MWNVSVQTNHEAHEDVVLVAAGTLDEEKEGIGLNGVKIDKEFWIKYRAAWVDAVDGAEQLQAFY